MPSLKRSMISCRVRAASSTVGSFGVLNASSSPPDSGVDADATLTLRLVP